MSGIVPDTPSPLSYLTSKISDAVEDAVLSVVTDDEETKNRVKEFRRPSFEGIIR